MEVMGTGHGGNGSAVTEQRTNEALLILAGQTHDLCVCDGGTSGGLGRVTTKSLSDQPCICVARRTVSRASGAMRASRHSERAG